MRYAILSLTLCGAILGYLFAKAEGRGFCTGNFNKQTSTCEAMPVKTVLACWFGYCSLGRKRR